MDSGGNEGHSSTKGAQQQGQLRKVTGGSLTAMRCRSLSLLHEVIAGLSKLGKEAVEGNMLYLLANSDVWIIWNEEGRSCGSIYFTPIDPGVTLIHGGFWDKKLLNKAEIVQALVDTRGEDLIACPLRRNRKGKLWRWWLMKNLDFEEKPPYDWMKGEDVFVMERKRCPQQ